MNLKESLNKSVDDMILAAINQRFERFIEAKGNPEKILNLLKEIMNDPGVSMALRNKDEPLQDHNIESLVRLNRKEKI